MTRLILKRFYTITWLVLDHPKDFVRLHDAIHIRTQGGPCFVHRHWGRRDFSQWKAYQK